MSNQCPNFGRPPVAFGQKVVGSGPGGATAWSVLTREEFSTSHLRAQEFLTHLHATTTIRALKDKLNLLNAFDSAKLFLGELVEGFTAGTSNVLVHQSMHDHDCYLCFALARHVEKGRWSIPAASNDR